jgi:hypothetical protein
MKAVDTFKTKADVALKLDELGIVYPKIKTGASKGKPTLTFKELCNLYDSFFIEESKNESVVVFPTFNPMTFRNS